MAFPDAFLDRLRQTADISSVMSAYVTLKRAGRDEVCLCPFHSEKTPSCHVYNETQSFYCFGCGAGGDVITFTRLIENLDYAEAVRMLAERNGIPVPEDGGYNEREVLLKTRLLEANRAAARLFRDILLSPAGAPALDYLYRRSLTPNIIKKYGIGYAPDDWGRLKMHMRGEGWSDDELVQASLLTRGEKGAVYDKFRDRIMFPIIDRRGNVIGFSGRVIAPDGMPKYLNSSETLVFKKRENLFSLNFAKNTKEKFMLLCEGNMDVIALNQAGFDNAVATLGTAVTPEQARLLRTYCEEAVIAYDSDSAGQAATMKAVNIFSDAGITARVLKMRDAKDPDEYIRKFGKESFAVLIKKASSAISHELEKIKTSLDLGTAEGRAEYLRKAVPILAGIENRLDRSVYTSEVARTCDISPDMAEMYVKDSMRGKEKKAARDERRALINQSAPKSREYRDESDRPHETKAERGIVSYIFHSPDKLSYILSKISPEDFFTVFNRRLFETLVLRLNKGLAIDTAALGGEFSAEEMGRIEGIRRESGIIGLRYTSERLDDYINALLKHKTEQNRKNPASMTDEELIEFTKELSKIKLS